MYLYESHLGGVFTSETRLTFEQRYCETCGDSDVLIGQFETVVDFWNQIKNLCSIGGSGGYTLSYIFPLMTSLFDLDTTITYDGEDDRAQGFCSNTESDILNQLEKYVGKIEVTNEDDYE